MSTTTYYKISPDNPVFIAHSSYMDKRKKAIKAAKDYLKSELKPDQDRINDQGVIVSILYSDHSRVPEGLRREKEYSPDDFVPKLTTKAGKEISKKFRSFKIKQDVSPSLIDHPDWIGRSGGRMCMYSPQVWRSKNGTIIAVIEVSKEYPFKRPEGFTEILPSEFESLKESK